MQLPKIAADDGGEVRVVGGLIHEIGEAEGKPYVVTEPHGGRVLRI